MRKRGENRFSFGLVLMAIIFLIAGTLHFVLPRPFLRIMPPALGHGLLLLHMSGGAEILGGLGLLLPGSRRLAAWGLAALLFCVWPANIYMAWIHLPLPGIMGQAWVQWARVPLQLPLIYWAWCYTRPRGA